MEIFTIVGLIIIVGLAGSVAIGLGVFVFFGFMSLAEKLADWISSWGE